jgi:hypothetical protein
MDSNETYVNKSEVNWSLLTEGLTLPVENQVVFARNMGHFLHRGEAKAIVLYLNGKGYRAQIRNVNFDSKFKRKNDTLQIPIQTGKRRDKPAKSRRSLHNTNLSRLWEKKENLF